MIVSTYVSRIYNSSISIKNNIIVLQTSSQALFNYLITGLYDTTEESPHWSVGNSGSAAGQKMPGDKPPAEAVVLRKDPIMLLNEHCQRNHLKVTRNCLNATVPLRNKRPSDTHLIRTYAYAHTHTHIHMHIRTYA